jgi:heme exporter protein CcmD
MDWLAPHTNFVASAYGVSAAALLALALYVIRKDQIARKRLDDGE